MTEEVQLEISEKLLDEIDANRRFLSRTQFMEMCINDWLEKRARLQDEDAFVKRHELTELQQRINRIARSFLDFTLTYTLEIKNVGRHKRNQGRAIR